jgi:hypothetical protein
MLDGSLLLQHQVPPPLLLKYVPEYPSPSALQGVVPTQQDQVRVT